MPASRIGLRTVVVAAALALGLLLPGVGEFDDGLGTAQAQTPSGISGSVPGRGQMGLLVAVSPSGVQAIQSSLRASGCEPAVIGQLLGGRWSLYLFGAPQAVNSGFPPSVSGAFFVRCGGASQPTQPGGGGGSGGGGPSIPQADGGAVTISQLNGVSILYGGQSGQDYLGLISSAGTGNSICNRNGPYGSTTSLTSVRNPNGVLGRLDAGAVEPNFNSDFSPYVQGAENPPKITFNGSVVGYLTLNDEKFGNRAVSPNALFGALGCG